jgi:hypothetical protein
VGQLAQSLKGTLRNGADVVAVNVEELQSAHTLMTHAIQFNSIRGQNWRKMFVDRMLTISTRVGCGPFSPRSPRLGNSIKGKMLRIRLKTTVNLYPFPIYLVCLDIDRKVRRKLITSEGGVYSLFLFIRMRRAQLFWWRLFNRRASSISLLYKKRTTGCCCCYCLSIYTACVHVYESLLLRASLFWKKFLIFCLHQLENKKTEEE